MSEQHPQTLHKHAPAPHPNVNANHLHQQELAQAHVIDHIIMWINDNTASVQGIILFTAIGICSLVGFLTGNIVLASIFGALSSYVLQLVYLALLMYAGKKSDRGREIQSDQIYKDSENTAHHMTQSMQHLDAQDVHILAIEQQHGEKLDALHAKIDALSGHVANEIDAHAAVTASVVMGMAKLRETPPAPPQKAPRSRKKAELTHVAPSVTVALPDTPVQEVPIVKETAA